MKHIFGFSEGEISFSIEKGQLYHLVRNGQTIARFDTEEKARLYSEGMIKGIDWGYSSGFEKGKVFQFKRINQHIEQPLGDVDMGHLEGKGDFQIRWCEHNKNIEGIYKHCYICYPKK